MYKFKHVFYISNMCKTCVILNTCFTHMDIFPVYVCKRQIGFQVKIAIGKVCTGIQRKARFTLGTTEFIV